MLFSIADHHYMSYALQLAEQGLMTTQPNPRVACVIVKQQKIIGTGVHVTAGEAHAEVLALRAAGAEANDAEVYVTLEPCNHHGRTPPCVDALIQARVRRVVVAMQDPNPLVAGHGLQRLRDQGIQVDLGLMEKEAQVLNSGFIMRMTRGRPYVRSKVAASLDGRTALNNGKSQWITSASARQEVQNWRAQSCAILTGIGTVLADNPSMTVRLEHARRYPLRVIVDSQLKISPLCKILSATDMQKSPVLIAYAQDVQHKAEALSATGVELLKLPDVSGQQVDLHALLVDLARREVNDVLVEAGGGLNGALLQARLIDEFLLYYAPKLMGNGAKGMLAIPEITDMQQVVDLQILDVRHIGQDFRVRARPNYPDALN